MPHYVEEGGVTGVSGSLTFRERFGRQAVAEKHPVPCAILLLAALAKKPFLVKRILAENDAIAGGRGGNHTHLSGREMDSLRCLDAGSVEIIEGTAPEEPLMLAVLTIIEVQHHVIVTAIFKNGDASGFLQPAAGNLALVRREERRPFRLQRKVLNRQFQVIGLCQPSESGSCFRRGL
jgi:hypothetical protein